jgi:hypothetical protein
MILFITGSLILDWLGQHQYYGTVSTYLVVVLFWSLIAAFQQDPVFGWVSESAFVTWMFFRGKGTTSLICWTGSCVWVSC